VYVTPALVAVNVLVFVLMVASGVSLTEPTVEDLLSWGADYGPRTTGGEWWRTVTCLFVHIGVIHILLNMSVLAAAGPLVERMVGNVGFLVLYLVSGLCGSFVSLLWHPLTVCAGASGAIFGVFGALMGLLLRRRGSVPREALVRLRNSGLAFLLFNLVFGAMQTHVDTAAHVGGLAGGFLGGIVLSPAFGREARARRPVWNFLLGTIGVFLAVAGIIMFDAVHGDLADAQLAPGESRVRHGNIDVFYTQGVTKDEADRLGAYLAKTWHESPDRRSVRLQKTATGYRVSLVIKPEFQKDERTAGVLALEGARISRDVFAGAAVEVDACDERWNVLRTCPPRPDIRYGVVEGRAEVFFATEADRADAQRLAEYLGQMLPPAPGRVIFKLARRGAVVVVCMVFDPARLNDPADIAALREDRKDIAANVFPGLPVELAVCDDLLNVVRVIEP
jgi:membrane associated rhomboid family serine protease